MVVAAVLFLSPTWMGVAGGLLVATVVVAAVRGVRLGRAPSALIVAGAACWAVAAGSPVWDRPAARVVAVMVDVSPSTRGAGFRDRAALDRRVGQLLGDTPYRVFAFAGGPAQPLPATGPLADVPCDSTRLVVPPGVDAVVLFSDGRFDRPAVAPPTFAVVDANLANAIDSAVEALRWSGDRVTATVTGASAPTTLRWTGADPATADVTGGGVAFARPTGDEVTAAVSGGDLWPENDRLTIRAPPPATAERWWVGSPPPRGFRAWTPEQLPTDPAAYLAAGVIVLDDVPGDALSSEQQQRLAGFVRDLGGGLVVGGGPHAFAAGGYGGTPLEDVSPLASDPPRSAERWVILVDGSGSMATADGPGPTPWRVECAAVARVVPMLPAADTVRVGSFAEAIRWWGEAAPGVSVATVPPADVGPRGVTNLSDAVAAVAAAGDIGTPTHLLLMTDADADLVNAAGLTAALRDHRVTLHLLATGAGRAVAGLRAMAGATGGSVFEQTNPERWVESAKQLARAARPRRFVKQPTPVTWHGEAGPATVAAWNRTWRKPTADALADGADAPLVAAWAAGTGHVAAVAFAADAGLLERLARRVGAPPHDPRFTVTCDAGAVVRVGVDAVDGDQYLNGLAVTLEVGDGAAVAVGQTGPGTYAAGVPAPRRLALATVRVDGRVIERFALPGRYAREFDGIGLDRRALATLAAGTGGAVVEPATTGPLRFPGPPRRTPLVPPLAAAGAAAVAAGLLRWRRG